jgi:DNA-binding MarR family transcriptional regulator
MEVVFLAEENGASFKTVVERSGIPPTTTAYHIKKLVKSGMIEKRYINIEGRRDYSFYQLTHTGDQVLLMINDIHNSIEKSEVFQQKGILPKIQIIPMRIGPRCVSINRLQG